MSDIWHQPRRATAASVASAAGRAVLFFALVSIALFVAEQARVLPTADLRSKINDLIAPLIVAMSSPVAAGKTFVSQVDEHIDIVAENRRLREENARLIEWQSVALKLERENAALRELLKLGADPKPTYLSARVIADPGGPFVRTVLLDVGTERGAVDGAAVVDAQGLVGRIVKTGKKTSRVLLLTDLDSRVPVIVERTGARAIVAGTNEAMPVLSFYDTGVPLQDGDRLVTSGHGGVFAANLPVGAVTKRAESEIAVRLFSDIDRLEFLRIVKYAPLPTPEDMPAAASPARQGATPDTPEPADGVAARTAARDVRAPSDG